MQVAIPPGFALAPLGKGFSERFGPVYIDRLGRRMAFRVSADHANPVDTCHGGALATFADAHIIAVRAGADEGLAHSPTISLSVDYVAPILLGAWVEAAITLVKVTRTMIFIQSLMTVGGEPVARSSAIYRNPDKGA
ncbi:MAG: thioesterase [Sphingomonas bacterium]|nr:thioesterase [Sphingomonas bacterium]